jgi:hypothetical protein
LSLPKNRKRKDVGAVYITFPASVNDGDQAVTLAVLYARYGRVYIFILRPHNRT